MWVQVQNDHESSYEGGRGRIHRQEGTVATEVEPECASQTQGMLAEASPPSPWACQGGAVLLAPRITAQ